MRLSTFTKSTTKKTLLTLVHASDAGAFTLLRFFFRFGCTCVLDCAWDRQAKAPTVWHLWLMNSPATDEQQHQKYHQTSSPTVLASGDVAQMGHDSVSRSSGRKLQLKPPIRTENHWSRIVLRGSFFQVHPCAGICRTLVGCRWLSICAPIPSGTLVLSTWSSCGPC